MFAEASQVDKKTFYIGDKPGLNINSWAAEIASQLNRRLPRIPVSLLRVGGFFGDILHACKIKFPLSSFRVQNMTTDNVISLLDDTMKIVPGNPYSVRQGVAITLDWLKSSDTQWRKR